MQPLAAKPALLLSETQPMPRVFMETKVITAWTWYLKCVTSPLGFAVKPVLHTCHQQMQPKPLTRVRTLQSQQVFYLQQQLYLPQKQIP